MTDETFEGQTRTNEGLSRSRSDRKPGFADIREAIQRAEAAAWEAIASGHPMAGEIHQATREALELVNATLFPSGHCSGPNCLETVPDKGFGRPALYCSARCKDRAAYQRKQQRTQREG